MCNVTPRGVVVTGLVRNECGIDDSVVQGDTTELQMLLGAEVTGYRPRVCRLSPTAIRGGQQATAMLPREGIQEYACQMSG